jgi:hypothetical protein
MMVAFSDENTTFEREEGGELLVVRIVVRIPAPRSNFGRGVLRIG